MKNSEEESKFVNNSIRRFRNIDIVNIINKNSLKSIVLWTKTLRVE